MSRRPSSNTNKQGVINRDVNAAERASRAVQLRAQKLTFDEIAKRCGYASPGSCRNAIMRELDRTVVRDVEVLRIEELDMLDRLHASVWVAAFPDGSPTDDGDDAGNEECEDEENPSPKKKKRRINLFAIDRLLTISESRRKLMGMDAHPDEHLTQQNYTKTIVLTHEAQPTSTGGEHDTDD